MLSTQISPAIGSHLQSEEFTFSWAYFWLATGGLLLILVVLAFAYLLVRAQRARAQRLASSPFVRNLDLFLSNHARWLWTFVRRRLALAKWHGMALTMAAVITLSAVYVFALVTESWIEQEALYAFDLRIYGWLIEAADSRMVDFMRNITRLGSRPTITAVSTIAALILLAYRRWWHITSLVLAVGAGTGFMHGLQWIFERSRPVEQVINAAGHSFPSGHAFMATTLYGWLIFLTWRLVRSDLVRILATIVLTILIFIIGLSRVVLRVHWVSDVVGGFAVGLAWLVFSLVLTQILHSHYGGRTVAKKRDSPIA